MGRAPRTKETLPDFLKWRRVTRPPLVFRGLAGSQRTPGFWGVTVPRQGTQTLGRQDGRASARAYAMKAVEDTDAPDVITGNFQIFDTIVHAFIDPGSTHSYICTDIPTVKNLPKSGTEYDILVMNPLGHSVIVNRVYRDCPIRLREYEFPGDLIELSFKEFDVILGMDWLSRH